MPHPSLSEPLQPSPGPAFPFEHIVADYFHTQGHQYLVYADRYTGWVTVAKCDPLQANANTLCWELCTLFGIYGAPVELTTDGGQPFASHQVQQFLRQWGVKWHVSSAYYTQSNGRAEVTVKTAKRLLMDNIQYNGGLDSDKFAQALLRYRNTPLPGLEVSPGPTVVWLNSSRPLAFLTQMFYVSDMKWIVLAENRERALDISTYVFSGAIQLSHKVTSFPTC